MPPKTEIVESHVLGPKIVGALKLYYQNSKGKKPGHIIYYRDGVSEGQFFEVLMKEMATIQVQQ